MRSFSNVIGFDDSPFNRNHKENIQIVGAIYAGLRLDGVLTGYIRRDGANAAKNIAELIQTSKFMQHIQLIMLQGVAFGGFNVVDARFLNKCLQRPVLIVARYQPDMTAIRESLLTNVSGGTRKWKLIENLGPMEPAANVFIQRIGLTFEEAKQTVEKFAIHSHIPEPLRTAHLIAGAIGKGQSRGRV